MDTALFKYVTPCFPQCQVDVVPNISNTAQDFFFSRDLRTAQEIEDPK